MRGETVQLFLMMRLLFSVIGLNCTCWEIDADSFVPGSVEVEMEQRVKMPNAIVV